MKHKMIVKKQKYKQIIFFLELCKITKRKRSTSTRALLAVFMCVVAIVAICELYSTNISFLFFTSILQPTPYHIITYHTWHNNASKRSWINKFYPLEVKNSRLMECPL